MEKIEKNTSKCLLNMINDLLLAGRHSLVENYIRDGLGIKLPVWGGRNSNSILTGEPVMENSPGYPYTKTLSIGFYGNGASHHDINPPECINYRYERMKGVLTIRSDKNGDMFYKTEIKETVIG